MVEEEGPLNRRRAFPEPRVWVARPAYMSEFPGTCSFFDFRTILGE
jgi:hypothetical protein